MVVMGTLAEMAQGTRPAITTTDLPRSTACSSPEAPRLS